MLHLDHYRTYSFICRVAAVGKPPEVPGTFLRPSGAFFCLQFCEILLGYSGDFGSLIGAVDATPGIAEILFLRIDIIAYFPPRECPRLETMHEHEQGDLGV